MSPADGDRSGSEGAPVLGRTTPGSDPAEPVRPAPATDTKGRARRSGSGLRPVAWAAALASLVVGILVTVFAAQNSQGVAVHFLGYSSQSAPQFLIILLSVVLGLLVGLLLGLGARRRRL